jgi:hypothetical protein
MSEKSFYKCVSSEYSTYKKGKIYPIEAVGQYLFDHPKDWKKVLPYPTTQELIECLEKGKNSKIIIKALKQWQKN